MKLNTNKYRNLIQNNLGYILFFTFFTIALFSFRNYGVGWDEYIQRFIGLFNFKYIFEENNAFSGLEYKDRYYGVAFELLLIFTEKALKLTDPRTVFLTRHLMSHIFFLIGALVFFKLVFLLYRDNLLSTIAFLLLVLHPGIYAHSFFNSKDIPFLTMFIICFYYCALAFEKKSVKNFLILGICMGFLIDIRIMGLLLLCFILFFLMIDMIREKKFLYHFKLGIVFISAALFVIYLFWPILWKNPVSNFLEAFKSMSKYPWDGIMLFRGDFVFATNLPWYYIPVWFIISTPIFYISCGFLSIVILFYYFIKNPFDYLKNNIPRNNILFLLCFLSPVLLVIILKSTLYDTWRHLYFIYPSFVLLIIYGFSILLKRGMKYLVAVSCFASFIFVSFFIIRNHPLEYVYFNHFVSSNPPEKIRKTYEMDYWGVSYKQALEYILENDDSEKINVAFENEPGKANILILKPSQRKRINIVLLEEAKYFITEYRWHPQSYKKFEGLEFNSVKVRNNTVSSTFKLK